MNLQFDLPNLSEFEIPGDLGDGAFTMGIFGPRCSGKTTLLRTIGEMYCNRENTQVFLVSITSDYEGTGTGTGKGGRKHIPILTDLREVHEILNERHKGGYGKDWRNKLNHLMFLVDEVEHFEKMERTCRVLRRILMNRRSLKTSLILTCQYPGGSRFLTPAIRLNLDLVAIVGAGRQRSMGYRKMLRDQYFSDLSSCTFHKYLDKYCVYNNKGVSGVIRDVRVKSNLQVVNNGTPNDLKYFNVSRESIWAVDVISDWWKGILNMRKGILREMGQELRFLPGVGIEFQNAREDFSKLASVDGKIDPS